MTAVANYVEAHVACAVSTLRRAAPDFDAYVEAMENTLQEHGGATFLLIARRAEMATQQLLAGQEPKLAQLGRESLAELEACLTGERIVREYRTQGVQASDRGKVQASSRKFGAALKSWHREHRRQAAAEREAHSIGRTEDEVASLK